MRADEQGDHDSLSEDEAELGESLAGRLSSASVAALRAASAPSPSADNEHYLGLDSTILGRYKILEVLGRGAFSVVYRAAQVGVGRIVALKVFHMRQANADAVSIERARSRFRREAHLASALRRPNSVMLYDYDKTDSGVMYMAFEYIDGPTLSQEIATNPGGMAPAKVIHIARQIAGSLQEAHEHGIVHRDLKPGNIMLTNREDDNSFVKVLDFGIAKVVEVSESDLQYESGPDKSDSLSVFDLATIAHNERFDITLDGKIIGTPRYIPPEQIVGDPVTPASDFYSLGLIIYEMLAGVPANPGRGGPDLVAWHIEARPFSAPAGLKLPAGLAAIVRKATRLSPSERYQSARELDHDLERLDDYGNAPDTPRVLSVPAIIAVNGLLAIALFVALSYWLGSGPQPARTSPLPPPDLSAKPDEPNATADPPTAIPAAVDAGETTDSPIDPDGGSGADGSTVAVVKPVGATSDAGVEPRQIEITSEPEGANVYVGKTRLGKTPFVLDLKDSKKTVTLKLWRRGYHSQLVKVSPDIPRPVFPIKLERYTFGTGSDKPRRESKPATAPTPKPNKEEPKTNDYYILD